MDLARIALLHLFRQALPFVGKHLPFLPLGLIVHRKRHTSRVICLAMIFGDP
jgi:hypothetical protein